MESKKILITGADGALGRVVAKQLLAEGWNLFAAVRSEKDAGIFKQNTVEYPPEKLKWQVCDITSEADVKKFITDAADFYGFIHIAGGFVANATLGESPLHDFDFMINLNARSAFLFLKEVMPVLKNNNEGCILTIGAKPALYPVAVNASYNASKAAVISLALTAAEEGRKNNVRVNCIVPAVIKTQANLSWAKPGEADRWTPPEDISNVISFLFSEKAKGITGTIFPMYNKIAT